MAIHKASKMALLEGNAEKRRKKHVRPLTRTVALNYFYLKLKIVRMGQLLGNIYKHRNRMLVDTEIEY